MRGQAALALRCQFVCIAGDRISRMKAHQEGYLRHGENQQKHNGLENLATVQPHESILCAVAILMSARLLQLKRKQNPYRWMKGVRPFSVRHSRRQSCFECPIAIQPTIED